MPLRLLPFLFQDPLGSAVVSDRVVNDGISIGSSVTRWSDIGCSGVRRGGAIGCGSIRIEGGSRIDSD